MATHDFECTKCGHIMENMLVKMSVDLDSVKCERCCRDTKNLSFGGLGSVFKGSSWATKNLKVKSQRGEVNKRLGKKQHDEHAKMKLVPNIAGVEVDNFRDAAKLAKEAGLDSQLYEKHAREEEKLGRYEKPY